MNIWETAIITNKGLALQAKLHSGTTLSLTRAVAGAGTVAASNLINQTSVADERKALVFSTQSYPEEGKCAVPLKLSNTDVAEGFTVRQIGVYAFDPDEGEILYLIAQTTAGQGTAVPSADEMPGYLAVWTFYIQYGQADGIEITVDPAGSITPDEVKAIVAEHNESKTPHAGVLATQAELEAHTGDSKNPHGVTAEQLGLGNVNNTADSEKHVAYASRAGEADKVKSSVTIRFNGGRTEGSDMWTFNGSTSRSVNITPAKIGAAEEEHTHSASDINSGTFATDRLPTVPVSKGGTGATTAAEALANLGAAAEGHYHKAIAQNDISCASNQDISVLIDRLTAAFNEMVSACPKENVGSIVSIFAGVNNNVFPYDQTMIAMLSALYVGSNGNSDRYSLRVQAFSDTCVVHGRATGDAPFNGISYTWYRKDYTMTQVTL